MLSASYVGTAPGTTTLMLRGSAGLGQQCPPDLLPLHLAPNQNVVRRGSPPPPSAPAAYQLYANEVELSGASYTATGILFLIAAFAGGYFLSRR